MKSIFLIMITLCCIMDAGCVSKRNGQYSAKADIQKNILSREIEDIIKGIDPNVNIGVKITSLASGEVIFEKNSKRHFVPASTNKLFTLAAALHYLGPSFRFNTTILTDGMIDHGGSINNLYIQGSGDPSLMDHEVIALVYELKQMGIKHITGNVYVDDKIFDDVYWGRGTMWDDRDRGFAAPVSGLNLNYNRLLIKTMSSRSINQFAHSIIKPATSFVDIVPKALSKSDGGQRSLSLLIERGNEQKVWPSATNDGLHFGDKIIVNGQTTKSAAPQYHLLAVNDPGMLVGTFLKDQLRHLGITVKGQVLRKATPADAIRLTNHESRSLAEALIDFTKISNNVANDALIKTIAANAGIKPATSSAGLKLVSEFLAKEVGIEPNSLITADGSGLSRYNLVTPEQMVKLLVYAANDFYMGPEFMAALPIGGEDGSLSKRLTADHQRGNVRAKTGTMSGLNSLVGYVTGNRRYAFAIMINGFIGSLSKYSRMQDQILTSIMADDQTQLAKVK